MNSYRYTNNIRFVRVYWAPYCRCIRIGRKITNNIMEIWNINIQPPNQNGLTSANSASANICITSVLAQLQDPSTPSAPCLSATACYSLRT